MNLDEFKDLVSANREYFYRYPEPVKVYLHWTAGRYDQTFDDYHFCVTGIGDIINTLPLTEIPSATWCRNTGSIAISLCCAYDATPKDLGNYPPTDEQMNVLAEMIRIISDVFDIPIDIQHFMTHAEAADNMDGVYMHEPYGPSTTCERWDLAITKPGDTWMDGGNIIRGNAIYYQMHE